eukprot:Em0295g3a
MVWKRGVGGGVPAGTGVGGEEVPVAIRKYFEDIAILLRNHPTVLPTTMLGLTNIDKNEAVVVRTTMASQQLGISPDAMLREIAYSHSRCFGKGERKFRFKVEGGYQQANCLGVYLCCLPATLKQELKTLLEVPAPAQGPPDVEDVAQNPLQPVPAQFPQGSPDVEHVAQNPAPAQLSALAFFDDVDVRRDVEAGDIARNPLQPAPVEGAGDAPRPAPEGTGGMVLVPINKSIVVVCEGRSTTLMVQVISYSPPYHVEWYLNSSLVKASNLYVISNISVSDASTYPITYNASLTISTVNLTTQGFYWVAFYDHWTVVSSNAIFVTPPVPKGSIYTFKLPPKVKEC